MLILNNGFGRPWGGNGGAIHNDGDPKINRTIFESNKANQNGGAIYIGPGATCNIDNGTFLNNSGGTFDTFDVEDGGRAIYNEGDLKINTRNF